MGQTDSKEKIRRKPGATLESAQDHLGEVKTLQSHVQQQVRERTAAIIAMKRKGMPRAALKAAIARLRPHQAQLNHLTVCVERLEASVIGIETHRLNRKTMAVMKNLTMFGTMTEREMEEAATVLDDVDVVASQHDELSHIVHQAGAAMAGALGDDDAGLDEVDMFFQLNDPDYTPAAAAAPLVSANVAEAIPTPPPANKPAPEPLPVAKLDTAGRNILSA